MASVLHLGGEEEEKGSTAYTLGQTHQQEYVLQQSRDSFFPPSHSPAECFWGLSPVQGAMLVFAPRDVWLTEQVSLRLAKIRVKTDARTALG